MWNKKDEQVGSLVNEIEVGLAPAPRSNEETPRIDAASDGTVGPAAFLETLLPMLGVMPSTVKEFPGLVRMVTGPEKGEITLHIDMASKPHTSGEKPPMERIVTLSVRLEHDYRLLGNGYYCIDCDLPENDTVH